MTACPERSDRKATPNSAERDCFTSFAMTVKRECYNPVANRTAAVCQLFSFLCLESPYCVVPLPAQAPGGMGVCPHGPDRRCRSRWG
jgi:hypothetical protein